MEHIVSTLESCFVTEGWHENWHNGPMPKLAADVVTYFRARAGGARENATEEAKVNAFVGHCGQSVDWIFGGDPGGLICKAAGNSPQSAGLSNHREPREDVKELSTGLSKLETPFFQVRSPAMATRMMGSSDDMPKEPGAALDVLADRIIDMMDGLIQDRDRLWILSGGHREGEPTPL